MHLGNKISSVLYCFEAKGNRLRIRAMFFLGGWIKSTARIRQLSIGLGAVYMLPPIQTKKRIHPVLQWTISPTQGSPNSLSDGRRIDLTLAKDEKRGQK